MRAAQERGAARRRRRAAGSSASARCTARTGARRDRTPGRPPRTVVTIGQSPVCFAPRRSSSASSSGSRSSAVTRYPARGEIERHPAGARADVEHRIAVARRPASATAAGPRRSRRTRRRARSRSRSPAAGSQNRRRVAAAASSSRSSSSAVYVGSTIQPARLDGVADRLVERRRQLGHDAQPLGRRRPRTSGARASSAARVPAHVTRRTRGGQHLEVGVPDPRDVAAVGGAVVEDRQQVELARPRAPACGGSRWRRPGS